MINFSAQNKVKALLILGAMGIVLIVASTWWSGSSSKGALETGTQSGLVPTVSSNQVNNPPLDAANSEEETLERRVESVLKQIAGIGEVKVSISLAAGSERVYATNQKNNRREVTERDEQGGTRTTTENTEDEQLVLLQGNGQNPGQPLIVQEVNPEINGVLVVAEGAGDARVREELTRTVQIVLNVPSHKVMVMPKVKGGG